jgi:predicted glycogen debranching enzyme
MTLDFGREICGHLATAESREWLCTNGIGGFASGTVSGVLTRRYHGLLLAALKPPLGRTLLVAKLEETVEYDGLRRALGANRWSDGSASPRGYHDIERFRLDGTTPVWTYAVGDALLEKRIWMEQGANTTYVRYRVLRARGPVRLEAQALLNYRDYHATTRGEGWWMMVEPVPAGLRVTAFEGARPFVALAAGAECQLAHIWYHRFELARERERGLDAQDDHLQAGTFLATIEPGRDCTIVLSAAEAPSLDGEAAWQRRQRHESGILDAWRRAQPAAARTPGWIDQLVLAADQFVTVRPLADDPDGMSIIAGYPWFGDWGRDAMISLPGLLLVTGRQEAAAKILATFARFVDRGMLPNRFPDAGEAPEYNTVDATLWYFEAIRAYHEATGDDALLKTLFPVLEDIVRWHRDGTRYGIAEDPADGLLRAGEPGVHLTWMDAKVGDWVVTPRIGKPVEVNALWYNALAAMAGFARRLDRPAETWERLAARVAGSFARFWNEEAGCCYDVIDGPAGHEDALRPNQIFAVSLFHTPLPPDRQRQVVDACSRQLLTSFGLRSLAPGHPDYQGRYAGGPRERDGAYHQGTVWGWLLGPFALAHLRVHGDRDAARGFLAPVAHHLTDHGLGSIAEIFDGDPPFSPNGCFAQAWSVAEGLRACVEIERERRAAPQAAPRRRPRAAPAQGEPAADLTAQ